MPPTVEIQYWVESHDGSEYLIRKMRAKATVANFE
jgi:hypothetical protein